MPYEIRPNCVLTRTFPADAVEMRQLQPKYNDAF